MEDAPRDTRMEEDDDSDDEESVAEKKPVMSKSFFEQMMKNQNKDEEKGKKVRKLFEFAEPKLKPEKINEKSEDREIESAKEADIDADPVEDAEAEVVNEFDDDTSVEEILESVEEEIEAIDEQEDELADAEITDHEPEIIDASSAETDPDSEPESLQQILQRQKYSAGASGNNTTSSVSTNSNTGNSNSSNLPNIPTPPTNPGQNQPPVPPIPPQFNQPPNMNNLPPTPPNVNQPPIPPQFPPQPPNMNIPNMNGPNTVNNFNTIVNPTEYHNTSPTAALLAVDYFSHKINKHRIEKAKKQLNSKIEKLKVKQESADYISIANNLKSKEQQDSMKDKIEKLEDKENVTLSMNNNKEIYNRLNIQESKKAKINEQISNKFENNFIERHIADPAIEIKTVPTFENTLEQIAKAESGGINSEFAYERRHEIKDTPGDLDKIGGSRFSPEFSNEPVSATTSPGVSKASSQQPIDLIAKARANNKNVYREAALTGAWGAVVGILVFIVIYILSHR